MKELRLLAILLAAGGIAACSSEPDRSVEWYSDRPAERQAKLVACAEQAQLASQADGNCARAQRAATLRRPAQPHSLPSVVED